MNTDNDMERVFEPCTQEPDAGRCLEASGVVSVHPFPKHQRVCLFIEDDKVARPDLEEGLSLILARPDMVRSEITILMPLTLVVEWLDSPSAASLFDQNCPHHSVILAGNAPTDVLIQWVEWIPHYVTDGKDFMYVDAWDGPLGHLVDWREDIDLIRGKRTRYPVINRPRHIAFHAREFPTAAPDARMGFRQETE